MKSQLCIPSAKNNFPPTASAPVEGTQYASANFNLYLITYLAFMVNLVNKKWKTENFYPTPAFEKQWEHLVQKNK